MLEITETKLRRWAAEMGIGDLRLAEQDLRLTYALQTLYADSFLSKHLYLKGGTAINKIYLSNTARLSIDLDFNAIGTKETVLAERRRIRDTIILLLKKQDTAYTIRNKDTYEQITIKMGYKPLVGPSTQHIKLEISTIERYPILGGVTKALKIPDSQESILLSTYVLEELMATKLRALYERLKGRDIYDLYFLSSRDFEKTLVRKLVLYYFYRSKKIFNPTLFFTNIQNKFMSKDYHDDVSLFVRGDIPFSLDASVNMLLSSYSFLRMFDEYDHEFLHLARYLLGKPVKKSVMNQIKAIEHPLRHLFQDTPRLSLEAFHARVEDIWLYFE